MPVQDWKKLDWKKMLEQKQARKGYESETARMREQTFRMRAGTEAQESEQRFGAGGIAREKMARESPYGMAGYQAQTGRISAEAHKSGAETAKKESEYWISEREQAATSRQSPEERMSELQSLLKGGDDEDIVATPGGQKICPEGHVLKKGKCVPVGFSL